MSCTYDPVLQFFVKSSKAPPYDGSQVFSQDDPYDFGNTVLGQMEYGMSTEPQMHR
jgi:hypothetical protein